MYLISVLLAFVVLLLAAGLRIVRATGRGLVEPFGKYRSLAMAGLNWLIPAIDRLFLSTSRR